MISFAYSSNIPFIFFSHPVRPSNLNAPLIPIACIDNIRTLCWKTFIYTATIIGLRSLPVLAVSRARHMLVKFLDPSPCAHHASWFFLSFPLFPTHYVYTFWQQCVQVEICLQVDVGRFQLVKHCRQTTGTSACSLKIVWRVGHHSVFYTRTRTDERCDEQGDWFCCWEVCRLFFFFLTSASGNLLVKTVFHLNLDYFWLLIVMFSLRIKMFSIPVSPLRLMALVYDDYSSSSVFMSNKLKRGCVRVLPRLVHFRIMNAVNEKNNEIDKIHTPDSSLVGQVEPFSTDTYM